LKLNSSELRLEWTDSVSIPAPLCPRSFSLDAVTDLCGHDLPKREWSGRTDSNRLGAANLQGFARTPTQSTQDCSGNWAHELGPRIRSSVSPILKMCTLVVSCRRTRSEQRVWFYVGKASRPFGSGHNDPAREKEGMLRMKTRIVNLDPHPQSSEAGFLLEGGS